MKKKEQRKEEGGIYISRNNYSITMDYLDLSAAFSAAAISSTEAAAVYGQVSWKEIVHNENVRKESKRIVEK